MNGLSEEQVQELVDRLINAGNVLMRLYFEAQDRGDVDECRRIRAKSSGLDLAFQYLQEARRATQ